MYYTYLKFYLLTARSYVAIALSLHSCYYLLLARQQLELAKLEAEKYREVNEYFNREVA